MPLSPGARLGPYGILAPFLLAALPSLAAPPAAPAVPTADALDRLLRPAMRALHVPGLAAVVVRDGRVAALRTWGLANVELGVAVGPDTVFEIGSVTKPFTAMLVLKLAEEGRLQLDDPLSMHLPEAPASFAGVTLRHLLTHTSGVKNYLLVPGLLEGTARPGVDHEAVGRLLLERLPLEFRPGETWSYSNSGYLLLGNVVERVTGRSYWADLEERVFRPLGMRSSGSSRPAAVIPGRASGYEWRDGALENRPALTDNAYSAGSIVSTPRDVARWAQALQAGRVLAAPSWEKAWTPARAEGDATAPFHYGLGWFVDTYRGRRVASHNGGTPGFSTFVQHWIDDGLTVFLLANHGDRVLDHLALDVAGLFVPALARPGGSPRDGDPATTARLRAALAGLATGRPALDEFTPAMRRFLGTATGEAIWAWVFADGEIRSFAFLEEERVGAERVLRFEARLGDVRRFFTVVLSDGGRIAQVLWW